MPSRRPPSQRDPAYALHRLPAAVKQVLPGTTVRNSTPVPKRQLTKIAAPSGGDSEHNGAGPDSTAVGTSATAIGSRSTAVGDVASASDDDATALGFQSAASGPGSIAVGKNAHASSNLAVAVGTGPTASGDQSIAVGAATTATALNSTALGTGAAVIAQGGVSVGASADVEANFSIAVGYNSQVYGLNGTAVGPASIIGTATSAVALGQNAQVDNAGTESTVLGNHGRSRASRGTAVGHTALVGVGHTNAVAIGPFASTRAANTALVSASSLEVFPLVTGGTALILNDGVGGRWQLTVDNTGTLTVSVAP